MSSMKRTPTGWLRRMVLLLLALACLIGLPTPTSAQGGDGDLPPGTHIDPDIPPLVTASWSQIPADATTVSVPRNKVKLLLTNSAAEAMDVTVDLTFIADGRKQRQRLSPVRVPAGGRTAIADALGWAAGAARDWRSPALFQGELSFTPVARRAATRSTASIALRYAHLDLATPGNLVLYDESAYTAQLRTMSFANNAGLGQRLRATLPAPTPEWLSQVMTYVHGDPILHEGAPDAQPDDGLAIPHEGALDSQPDGELAIQHSAAAAQLPVTLCLEWYTAPVDNGFGEDYGLDDGGWRARGALVRIYYSGNLLYDGYLNEAGCRTVYIGQGGGQLHVEIEGVARLFNGWGYNYLHRMLETPLGAPLLHWTQAININNVQGNAPAYRPEVFGNDAFSIISYAAQERFNGGLSGHSMYLIQDGCDGDDSRGSCSIPYQGVRTMFVTQGQWRRKYLIGHEYGHSILSFAVSGGANDCSYGSGSASNHGMNSVEYASCAAMEGWAHFVSASIWNDDSETDNPGGRFVYWDNAETIYDVEPAEQECYARIASNSGCDVYGVEKDWMRQWWDYRTNDRAQDPGSRPSLNDLFDLIDEVNWQDGTFAASNAIEAELSGEQAQRWRQFACTNGIAWSHCN
jgi:hypothetical protein